MFSTMMSVLPDWMLTTCTSTVKKVCLLLFPFDERWLDPLHVPDPTLTDQVRGVHVTLQEQGHFDHVWNIVIYPRLAHSKEIVVIIQFGLMNAKVERTKSYRVIC